MRERALEMQQQKKKQYKNQHKKRRTEEDVNELPEVDQNTKKLTQRSVGKTGKAKHWKDHRDESLKELKKFPFYFL